MTCHREPDSSIPRTCVLMTKSIVAANLCGSWNSLSCSSIDKSYGLEQTVLPTSYFYFVFFALTLFSLY